MKQYDEEGTIDKAVEMLDQSKLAQTDATEWVIIHSQLLDKETGRCAMSPPMLSMHWDVAKTVYQSLIEAALDARSRTQDECWLALLQDETEVMRAGIFDELGHDVVPQEVFTIMDKRMMTHQLYNDMYVKSATGQREVREMPFPEPPQKRQFH
ncbi:hypothetical protein AH156_20120 [Salmonella enterica subsp. enterica serovar Enteritidis]|nr:hypothetical protein [Salmonella enterica subsp. enterica serovar Enteritidis]